MNAASSTNVELLSPSNDKSWNIGSEIDQTNADDEIEDMHAFSDSAVDIENEDESDRTELIHRKKHPVWSFAYYQEFFDVDTTIVLQRIKQSMTPLPHGISSHALIKRKPDMYGPFWICVTLVLCIGICGNLSNLFNNFSKVDYKYTAQFDLLPIAAVVIYCYTFFVPMMIKAFFWWRKTPSGLSLSQIICTYGYSMSVFIPASILYVIPNDHFTWLVVALAASLSGIVIILSLWPAFKKVDNKAATIAVGALFVIHVTVMVCIKLYFYSPVYPPSPAVVNSVSVHNAYESTTSIDKISKDT